MQKQIIAPLSTLVFLALLGVTPHALAISKFESQYVGEWAGTFHQQPGPKSRDEGIAAFRLVFTENRGRLAGNFYTPSGPAGGISLRGVGTFDYGLCFDVIEGEEDMRWCVRSTGSTMSGVWSGGPQGGPILGGLGVGVRLFQIDARKAGLNRRRRGPVDHDSALSH